MNDAVGCAGETRPGVRAVTPWLPPNPPYLYLNGYTEPARPDFRPIIDVRKHLTLRLWRIYERF
jgi:hypothetical protein